MHHAGKGNRWEPACARFIKIIASDEVLVELQDGPKQKHRAAHHEISVGDQQWVRRGTIGKINRLQVRPETAFARD
jgi:hypothetical protein